MNNRKLLTAAGTLALAVPAVAQQYTVIELDAEGRYGQAWALNEAGAAAGYVLGVDDVPNFRAVIWGEYPDIIVPVKGYTQSQATALSAAGSAVCVSFTLGNLQTISQLADSAGASLLGNFSARAVNASGTVVGTRTIGISGGWYGEQACRWSAGTLTGLSTLGGNNGTAMDVNDEGIVVGSSMTATGLKPRACAWINDTVRDLGTLGGTGSSARAINSARHVVGVADTSAGRPHAFRFTLDAAGTVLTRTDLGVLGLDWSTANDVNDAGEIVGTSAGKAFLWRAGVMQDLNALVAGSGWRLDVASAISNSGRIVGWGLAPSGVAAAFMLAPTCPVDFDGDGFVTGIDFDLYVAAFEAGDMRADFDHDGFITGIDYDLYVVAFEAGC